jgi:hypothetical protein
MRNNGLGEAEIKIKEHRTFRGTQLSLLDEY